MPQRSDEGNVVELGKTKPRKINRANDSEPLFELELAGAHDRICSGDSVRAQWIETTPKLGIGRGRHIGRPLTSPISRRLRECRPYLVIYSDETTNLFPSLSLNIAYVPQACFSGGPSNSTPRFFNSSYVLSMSSQVYDMFINEPIRFSSPSGVNNTTRVSAFGIRNSIQRCFSSKGWSVIIVNPSLSV